MKPETEVSIPAPDATLDGNLAVLALLRRTGSKAEAKNFAKSGKP